MFNYDESSDSDLPPETRISATPIGSGFVNVINLDDIDKPATTDSSDFTDSSDSDSDVQFIMRRPIRRLPPPRPPSRRQYKIERPKTPIEIAPVVNRIDEQMVIENQALQRRIQQLQNENQQKQRQLQILQNDNQNIQRQIQHFQNEDQKNQRYIKNLQEYADILQNKIDKLQDEMQIYKDYIVKYK